MRRLKRAVLALALALLPLACASPRGTRVERIEGESMRGIRRLGVLPFQDPSGKGVQIADAIEAGLRPLLYETARREPIARELSEHKPDQDFGLSLEAYEMIRQQTGADGLLVGRMLPDWSAGTCVVYETELGDPVIRVLLKPRGKGRKRFETPDEVAAEVLRVLADRR